MRLIKNVLGIGIFLAVAAWIVLFINADSQNNPARSRSIELSKPSPTLQIGKEIYGSDFDLNDIPAALAAFTAEESHSQGEPIDYGDLPPELRQPHAQQDMETIYSTLSDAFSQKP